MPTADLVLSSAICETTRTRSYHNHEGLEDLTPFDLLHCEGLQNSDGNFQTEQKNTCGSAGHKPRTGLFWLHLLQAVHTYSKTIIALLNPNHKHADRRPCIIRLSGPRHTHLLTDPYTCASIFRFLVGLQEAFTKRVCSTRCFCESAMSGSFH